MPRFGAAGLVLAFIVLAAACGADTATPTRAPSSGVSPTPAPSITASVLVEPGPGDARWLRDLRVTDGTDGYELLDAATDGDIVAEWYPEYRSHFVSQIFGISPGPSQFWGVFVWNESTPGWEPLPVGADLFSVKNGHIMAWALVAFDSDTAQLPASVP